MGVVDEDTMISHMPCRHHVILSSCIVPFAFTPFCYNQGVEVLEKVGEEVHAAQDQAAKAAHVVSDKAQAAAQNAKDAGANAQSKLSGLWQGR